jgi:HSP20 family molecular chaperone IbpA
LQDHEKGWEMIELLPELSSVHLHETETELVVEVEVPTDLDLPRLAAQLREGVLTITVPRGPHRARHIAGFHPDVTGV